MAATAVDCKTEKGIQKEMGGRAMQIFLSSGPELFSWAMNIIIQTAIVCHRLNIVVTMETFKLSMFLISAFE